MEWLAISVSIASVVINLLVILAGVVWAVAEIKGTADNTTAKLSVSLNHLADAVRDLKHWLEDVDRKVDVQGQRLAHIEGQVKVIKDEVKDSK